MAVSLASNALITVEEFLRYRGIPDTDEKTDRDRLRFLINGASQEVQNALRGRILIAPSSQRQEVFDGDGESDVYVKHRRIADEDDIAIYYRDGTSWTAVSYSTEVTAEIGHVLLLGGYVFWRGKRNWRIDYKPGWTQAALPDDLKVVCMALVDRQIQLAEDKEGMSSQSFGDVTTSYNYATGWGMTGPKHIPAQYRSVLDAYRIISLG